MVLLYFNKLTTLILQRHVIFSVKLQLFKSYICYFFFLIKYWFFFFNLWGPQYSIVGDNYDTYLLKEKSSVPVINWSFQSKINFSYVFCSISKISVHVCRHKNMRLQHLMLSILTLKCCEWNKIALEYLDMDWGIFPAAVLSPSHGSLLPRGSEKRSLVWVLGSDPTATSSLAPKASPPSFELSCPAFSCTEALRFKSEVEEGTKGARPGLASSSGPSPHNSWSTDCLFAPPSDPDPSWPFSTPSPESAGSRVALLSEGESSDPKGEPSDWGSGFRKRDTSALLRRRPKQKVNGWWSAFRWEVSLRSLLEPISSRSCWSVCCRALRLRWRCIRKTYCLWLT